MSLLMDIHCMILLLHYNISRLAGKTFLQRNKFLDYSSFELSVLLVLHLEILDRILKLWKNCLAENSYFQDRNSHCYIHQR